VPSIHAIVTRGFGTFAAVADVPTRGYGTGAAPPPVVTTTPGSAVGGGARIERHSLWRGKTLKDDLRKAILGLEDVPEAQPELKRIVRKVAETRLPKVAPVRLPHVDFEALAKDVERAWQVVELWEMYRQEQEDDDDLLLLS
jgi:hypothetical protein